MLAYYIVCPWEAVAIGRIASYIFPAMNSFELYRVAGKPVFLPHLDDRAGADGVAHSDELSRNPYERQLSRTGLRSA